MVYRTKPGHEVVARTFDRFNIPYHDWIGRSPLWLEDGLADMDVVLGYEHVTETLTVTDYVIKLPCDLKLLDNISKDGEILRNIPVNVIQYPAQKEELNSDRKLYDLTNQGYAAFAFTDEDVVVNYRKLPVDYDTDLKVYFPRVPDNSMFLQAMTYYLLMRCMERGFKHPTYRMDSNNPYTNIHIVYDKFKRRAQVSISTLDPAERQ